MYLECGRRARSFSTRIDFRKALHDVSILEGNGMGRPLLDISLADMQLATSQNAASKAVVVDADQFCKAVPSGNTNAQIESLLFYEAKVTKCAKKELWRRRVNSFASSLGQCADQQIIATGILVLKHWFTSTRFCLAFLSSQTLQLETSIFLQMMFLEMKASMIPTSVQGRIRFPLSSKRFTALSANGPSEVDEDTEQFITEDVATRSSPAAVLLDVYNDFGLL